jgi:hypothetical protein
MKKFKKTNKLIMNIRTFSCSSILKMGDDIIARIEALRLKNESNFNAAKVGEQFLNKAKETMDNSTNKILSIRSKSQQERENMTSYIDHFTNTNVMPQTDITKVKEILAKSERTEELFDKKITEVSESENPSMLKLIKLVEIKEKNIHDAEDKVESLINKSVERGISKGEYDIDFQLRYFAARALRLKERKEFLEEEKKVFSESVSNLSPIDYVGDIRDSEMPSNTDYED